MIVQCSVIGSRRVVHHTDGDVCSVPGQVVGLQGEPQLFYVIIVIKLLPLFGGYVVTNIACHHAVLPAVSSVSPEECIFRQVERHVHNVVVVPCFRYASYINSVLYAHSMNLVDFPHHAPMDVSVRYGGEIPSRSSVIIDWDRNQVGYIGSTCKKV